MNRNTLIVIAAGAVAAVGAIVYLSRTSSAPNAEQTQGAIVLKQPMVRGSFCVQPVSNNSQKPVVMDGVTEALVKEMKAAGMNAGLTSDMNGGCDATIYTEIVELGRKSATLDFRVSSKDQLAPVLSATVKGNSESRSAAAFASSFAPKQDKDKSREEIDRASLAAAFGEQVKRIIDNRDKLTVK